MAVSAEIIEKLNKLDLSNMRAAAQYIDFLLYNQTAKKRENGIEFGCWEGQLKYISDQFDEPIDDFEEYM